MRVMNLKAVNEFINDPAIRPTIEQGEEPLTARHVLFGERAIVLSDGFVMAFFQRIDDGVYKGHIAALPMARGAHTLAAAKEAIDKVFGVYGGKTIVAAVPLALPAARLLCRWIGMRSVAKSHNEELFKLEATEWAAS